MEKKQCGKNRYWREVSCGHNHLPPHASWHNTKSQNWKKFTPVCLELIVMSVFEFLYLQTVLSIFILTLFRRSVIRTTILLCTMHLRYICCALSDDWEHTKLMINVDPIITDIPVPLLILGKGVKLEVNDDLKTSALQFHTLTNWCRHVVFLILSQLELSLDRFARASRTFDDLDGAWIKKITIPCIAWKPMAITTL